jgi:hypothetical protein
MTKLKKKSNSQKNKKIQISNELNDDRRNFNFFKMIEANPIQP